MNYFRCFMQYFRIKSTSFPEKIIFFDDSFEVSRKVQTFKLAVPQCFNG